MSTTTGRTQRARNVVIDAARPSSFPHLEFHLRKLNRFFIAENIYTTFPDTVEYARSVAECSSDSGRVTACLLYTFQANDGAYAPATNEDLAEERRAFLEGLAGHPLNPVVDNTDHTSGLDNRVSELIGYDPAAALWKDISREVFFAFCDAIHSTLAAALPKSAELDSQEPFFMDWCDPATGLPMRTARGGSNFMDADAIEQMFPYDSIMVAGAGGGCRIVKHPVFGLCVYPAAAVLFFPEESLEAVKEALLSLTATSTW